MTDIVQYLLKSVVRDEPCAPAIAYGVGVLTSAGSCLAPRLASLAGIAARAPVASRLWIRVSFIGGLTLSYTLIGASGLVLAGAASASTVVYAALAAALIWQGLRSIVSGTQHVCGGHATTRLVPSYGATFLTGASFALVVSPCCTPVLFAIAAMGRGGAMPIFALAVAASFALGHASPLLAGEVGLARIARLTAARFEPALAVVSGAVVLALGGYYALLV